MNRVYYVSNRIIGVYFRNEKDLLNYYEKATKSRAGKPGVLKFNTKSGLEQYIIKNGKDNNQYNCIWKAN